MFANLRVTNVNNYSKQISLYLPIQDVDFITKSLLYLNYLKHQRNLAVSVFVTKKELVEKFISGKANSKEAEFAWKMNAGDNIVFTDDKGNKVDLQTQLLSQNGNISAAEVFVKLKFNKDSAENNFNFANKPIQAVDLSDKLSLIVKPDWYANGEKVSPDKLNSKVLSRYQKQIDSNIKKNLDKKITLKAGKQAITDLLAPFNTESLPIRYVSLTSGSKSDISSIKADNSKEQASFIEVMSSVPGQISYFVDKNGILIDCQGTIRSSRNVQWKILSEKMDSSYYKYANGTFFVEKEGFIKPVVYLPSANAVVGFENSNILK